MAKPISATPLVTGKDAELIMHEIEHGTPDTPKRIATLRRADEVYRRMMSLDRPVLSDTEVV